MGRELDETVLSTDGAGSERSGALLSTGELFADRYRVEGMLGEGGMGAVYRVHDQRLDEVVALKLLTLADPSALERFVREVRLARRVTHPHVARTHDIGEHRGLPFLTMEYIEGESLDELLEREGPLPPMRVKQLGAAIAEGLAAAHQAGIVHRDLKPGNVLLADGRVVITDFGIARTTAATDKRLTQAVVVGTPYYMAPEQLTGGDIDARTDLYALGVVLFEMVTGSMPFDGKDAVAAAIKRLHQEPPDPRSRVSLPEDLAAVIDACLARDPDGRPASAADVRDGLSGRRSSGSALTSTPGSLPLHSSDLFAPLQSAGSKVAVLPFVERGAAADEFLGEGLAEELIDILSRTKGLHVVSFGATRAFADNRDPRAIRAAVGADAVVDGTVQMSRDRVRLSARLIDTDTAEQRWNERFDGRFEDVFQLQESMGQRVAEALRVELSASSYRSTAPPEAIELYLRARKSLRGDIMHRAEEALQLLDRCLELAPGFAPAIAGHAMATVRAWWGTERDVDGARGRRAAESVQRAVERVPDLAETHHARAMFVTQQGDFPAGAAALSRALEIAPTMAEAHQYLGQLQIEAGRRKEGRRRLELALELDPTLTICHFALSRDAVLQRDMDRFEHHQNALRQAFPAPILPALVSFIRYALYLDRPYDDLIAGLKRMKDEPSRRMASLFGVITGESSLDEGRQLLQTVPHWLTNERFTALMKQIFVEVFLVAGEVDEALDALVDLGENSILIDVLWLDRCPHFDGVRDDPRFVQVRSTVGRRAARIWQQ